MSDFKPKKSGKGPEKTENPPSTNPIPSKIGKTEEILFAILYSFITLFGFYSLFQLIKFGFRKLLL